jgi:hypothetical protein
MLQNHQLEKKASKRQRQRGGDYLILINKNFG